MSINGDVEVAGDLLEPARDRIREVCIARVDNGFIISIGCRRFVATSWTEASDGLSLYWKDPIGAEKQFCGKHYE